MNRHTKKMKIMPFAASSTSKLKFIRKKLVMLRLQNYCIVYPFLDRQTLFFAPYFNFLLKIFQRMKQMHFMELFAPTINSYKHKR